MNHLPWLPVASLLDSPVYPLKATALHQGQTEKTECLIGVFRGWFFRVQIPTRNGKNAQNTSKTNRKHPPNPIPRTIFSRNALHAVFHMGYESLTFLPILFLVPPDSVRIDGGPVIEVAVNTSYNLTCVATNGKPAPAITWHSNFEPILNKAESVNATLADGKRQDVTSYLTIEPQKSDQGRTYDCHAVNDAMLQRMWTTIRLEVICKQCFFLGRKVQERTMTFVLHSDTRLIGRFCVFRPKGRGFESRSNRHVGTLDKYFTRSCLWRFGAKLRNGILGVSGAPLSCSGL